MCWLDLWLWSLLWLCDLTCLAAPKTPWCGRWWWRLRSRPGRPAHRRHKRVRVVLWLLCTPVVVAHSLNEKRTHEKEFRDSELGLVHMSAKGAFGDTFLLKRQVVCQTSRHNRYTTCREKLFENEVVVPSSVCFCPLRPFACLVLPHQCDGFVSFFFSERFCFFSVCFACSLFFFFDLFE